MTAFATSSFAGSLGTELSSTDASFSKQTGYTANAIIGGDGNWLVTTSNSTYAIYQHSASPAGPNYRVGANFAHIGGALSYELGLIGRASAAADTFYLLTYQQSTNKTRLFKRVAGVTTQLGSDYTAFTLTTTPAAFELVMDGTQISVKIDGATVIGPISDSAITAAGKAGVLTFNSRELGVADRAKIDDWYAEDIIPASTLSGGPTLDDLVAAGALTTSASDMAGGGVLDDVVAAGSLGPSPGTCVIPALKNWGGSLQLGVTVNWVTFSRISDAVQVLAVSSQVTNGTTGDLSVANAALVPGTWYMATGWSTDGSQRFAVPVQAT